MLRERFEAARAGERLLVAVRPVVVVKLGQTGIEHLFAVAQIASKYTEIRVLKLGSHEVKNVKIIGRRDVPSVLELTGVEVGPFDHLDHPGWRYLEVLCKV